MRFKIIEEYERYYVGICEYGYRECFDKYKYEPNPEGYIIRKKETNYTGGIALPPEKVNKLFNINSKDKGSDKS